jgi:hypothetical protein
MNENIVGRLVMNISSYRVGIVELILDALLNIVRIAERENREDLVDTLISADGLTDSLRTFADHEDSYVAESANILYRNLSGIQ